MAERNLLRTLRADETEPAELEQLLLHHYGHGSTSINESTFNRQNEPVALRLCYNKEWQLAAVVTGPSFDERDEEVLCAKIVTQLLTPGPIAIGRTVLFSPLPVTGWFRFEDKFQILPVPKDAPRPDHLFAKHPLLLEVRFTSSADWMVSMRRRARKEREVELLCAALINVPVRKQPTTPMQTWVLKPGGSEGECVLAQELYTWPGADMMGTDFSNVAGISPMDLVDPQSYYTRRGISVGQSLDLPADVAKLLDVFTSLDLSGREQFLRASYWFRHANDVWEKSQSAAYTALVAAVEAIMPVEKALDRCASCHRPIGKGPTARFTAFVDEFVGKVIPEDDRNIFYRTRSALSHGGKLLHGDEFNFDLGPKLWGEYQEMAALSQIVRLTLHNWLSQRIGTV